MLNQSGFGKLLVVDKNCKLSIKEIKGLTNSKFAFQLKQSDANYLIPTLQFGLYFSDARHNFRNIKVYRLDNNALSTFMILKDDIFVTAIEPNETQLKEIACYVNIIDGIRELRESAIETTNFYTNLAPWCDTVNVDMKSLSSFAPSISAYKEAEIDANAIEQDLIAKIKEILRPTW